MLFGWRDLVAELRLAASDAEAEDLGLEASRGVAVGVAPRQGHGVVGWAPGTATETVHASISIQSTIIEFKSRKNLI